MKKILRFLKKYFVPHVGNDHKPHFLRRDSMLFFFIFVIIIEIGFLSQVFLVFDRTKFLASVLPGVLATLTNEERAQNNVPPLVENDLLQKAAQMKAEDMASKGYFAHTSPEGKTPWYWLVQVGYKYTYAGENLAVNFFESEDVGKAWMNSPTHRANIVKENYTEIGIGVAEGTYEGRNTIFVAQFFGTPLKLTPIEKTDSTPTPLPAIVKAEIPKATPKPVEPEPVKVTYPTPTTSEPAPEPVVNTETVEETPAPTPTPTEVKILGEESITAPVGTLKAEGSGVRSFIQRALTSPRQSTTYAYTGIALLVLMALMIAVFRTEVQHPKMVLRGLGLVAVIIVITFLNTRFLSYTEVPTDISANAISAIE